MLTTKNGTIPVCEEVPIGTYTKKSGATIETLVLEKGYYRTSRASVVVLECYLKDACVGGTNAENYCATGYKGPCKCTAEEQCGPFQPVKPPTFVSGAQQQ